MGRVLFDAQDVFLILRCLDYLPQILIIFYFDSVVFAMLYISQADKTTQYQQSTQSSKLTFCGVVVTQPATFGTDLF